MNKAEMLNKRYVNESKGATITVKNSITKEEIKGLKQLYPDSTIKIEQELLHAIYENENGNQECAVWSKGQEPNAVYFEVVNGILKIK